MCYHPELFVASILIATDIVHVYVSTYSEVSCQTDYLWIASPQIMTWRLNVNYESLFLA